MPSSVKHSAHGSNFRVVWAQALTLRRRLSRTGAPPRRSSLENPYLDKHSGLGGPLPQTGSRRPQGLIAKVCEYMEAMGCLEVIFRSRSPACFMGLKRRVLTGFNRQYPSSSWFEQSKPHIAQVPAGVRLESSDIRREGSPSRGDQLRVGCRIPLDSLGQK